jgi:hypothetical protein
MQRNYSINFLQKLKKEIYYSYKHKATCGNIISKPLTKPTKMERKIKE